MSSWGNFIKAFRDILLSAAAAPKGADLGAQTTVVELGSGFDLDAERATRRAILRDACELVVHDPALIKRDITGDGIDETFCNQALSRIAERMGCRDFLRYRDGSYPTANKEYDTMAISWRRDSAERAFRHANRGGLAVAAKKYATHGHVAVIYPSDQMGSSGHWGQVPFVANVGKLNQIMPVNNAFPVLQGPPDYFLWRSESV